jgi:uncharacterized membrane protein YdcZ (DUF606 family)
MAQVTGLRRVLYALFVLLVGVMLVVLIALNVRLGKALGHALRGSAMSFSVGSAVLSTLAWRGPAVHVKQVARER